MPALTPEQMKEFSRQMMADVDRRYSEPASVYPSESYPSSTEREWVGYPIKNPGTVSATPMPYPGPLQLASLPAPPTGFETQVGCLKVATNFSQSEFAFLTTITRDGWGESTYLLWANDREGAKQNFEAAVQVAIAWDRQIRSGTDMAGAAWKNSPVPGGFTNVDTISSAFIPLRPSSQSPSTYSPNERQMLMEQAQMAAAALKAQMLERGLLPQSPYDYSQTEPPPVKKAGPPEPRLEVMPDEPQETKPMKSGWLADIESRTREIDL
jgi:hypothetical protein